ncbi:hypothetical protein [Streptomyces prunicolor]|uniref:Uncharacterized protein n=1 Tax=Streptomyces prunicolor TaxID=67348 RepID=A0ABU4FI74_9ACTN|nr:hypothetical protein [Streptomyces prunicolor]MCX5239462.1 hypothetical protein [Streptomyces prunicolor]MDV7220294.1 hypothetical protein [Streptomyces prunicolor]
MLVGAHDLGVDGDDPVEVVLGACLRERNGADLFPGVVDQRRDASGRRCRRLGELPPSPGARDVLRHQGTRRRSPIYGPAFKY